MDITETFVSQRLLRNPEQIAHMIQAIRDGSPLPPILIAEHEDGTTQILDGHHRAAAYWLAGRRELLYGEYLALPGDAARPRFGWIEDLICRCHLTTEMIVLGCPT